MSAGTESSAGFAVDFYGQDIIESNAEDSFREAGTAQKHEMLATGFIDKQGAITKKGWNQLNKDIAKIERNAMTWLRKTFHSARDEGHGSDGDLIGSFWFDPLDPEQAHLIDLASEGGRQERIDMTDASYGDFADTAFNGASDFGATVLGGSITFFAVKPEDMEIVEQTLEVKRRRNPRARETPTVRQATRHRVADKRLDDFTRQYIETALWSSTDNADDSGGEPLDKNYSSDDIDPATMEQMIADCASFQEKFAELLSESGIEDGRAGHDFWLSRNGHGSGYFDEDTIDEEFQEKLQDAAESYGNVDLQVDDGVISDGIHWTPAGTNEARRRPMARTSRVGHAQRLGRETRRHTVADFTTPPEIIAHAQSEGATHVVVSRSGATVYFPIRSGGRYEEANLWHEHGYWHSPAPTHTKIVDRLPKGAEPIGEYLAGGQVAAERHGHAVRDYVAVDPRGRVVGGPYTDYGQAKRSADSVGGYVEFSMKEGRGRRGVVAARRPTDRLAPGSMMTAGGVLMLAGELSKKVGGTTPKLIEGGFRWIEPNQSAQFTTYSPEHGQKVVVVVSIFSGSTALGFFSNEGLSETDRYENISSFTYGEKSLNEVVTVKEMVKDVEWVWETVDGYAESWGAGQDEMDEARSNSELPEELKSVIGTLAHNRQFTIADLQQYTRFDRPHIASQAKSLVGKMLKMGYLERTARGHYFPTKAGWAWIEGGVSETHRPAPHVAPSASSKPRRKPPATRRRATPKARRRGR